MVLKGVSKYILLIGLLFVLYSTEAKADSFVPENSTPIILITDLVKINSNSYELNSYVEDGNSLADLNSIEWCFYLKDLPNPCLLPNSETNVLFTWTRVDNKLSINGGEYDPWQDIGSTTNYIPTNTQTIMNLKFIINKPIQGREWEIRAMIDDGDVIIYNYYVCELNFESLSFNNVSTTIVEENDKLKTSQIIIWGLCFIIGLVALMLSSSGGGFKINE